MARIPRAVCLLTVVACAGFGLTGCVGVSVTAQERPFFKALDDFGTRADINGRLLAEDPVLFANVSSTVIEGRVHLAGTVANDEQKSKAAQIAWAAPNVREVVNNIEVTQAGGLLETANDKWIAGQVRARILSDGRIRDSNYSIDTQNGVVYIMGIAQNERELDYVLQHASGVRGVKQVVNYAITKDDPRRQSGSRSDSPVLGSSDDEVQPNAVYGSNPSSAPPVLTQDEDGGITARAGGNYLPEPVDVTPMSPAPAGTAHGAPRRLHQ
ncbi:MAG TPA: hypothetical protein DCL54_15445 [Alphaproteobacteria bacterium]|nr:hypothetical protein [Alphaproteobacteria bacterium]HAJ47966.1 hypothetical protein [Alphaproteobacteria bacterium]